MDKSTKTHHNDIKCHTVWLIKEYLVNCLFKGVSCILTQLSINRWVYIHSVTKFGSQTVAQSPDSPNHEDTELSKTTFIIKHQTIDTRNPTWQPKDKSINWYYGSFLIPLIFQDVWKLRNMSLFCYKCDMAVLVAMNYSPLNTVYRIVLLLVGHRHDPTLSQAAFSLDVTAHSPAHV